MKMLRAIGGCPAPLPLADLRHRGIGVREKSGIPLACAPAVRTRPTVHTPTRHEFAPYAGATIRSAFACSLSQGPVKASID
jgi:hypothetical protein